MKIQGLLKPLLVGSSLILCVTVMAADRPTRQVNRGGGVVVTEEIPPKLDFSFTGGTLAEFVAQLNTAAAAHWKEDKPNLIFPAAAGSIPLPKLELRSVDMESLMSAINSLLNRTHIWRRLGDSTWVLESPPDRRKTQVFYVGHLLAKFKIDDINTALTTVWEMGGESKPELKYHKDTQLLIIRADTAQLETALMVLTQLRDALPGKDPAAAAVTNQPAKQPSR